MTLHIKRSHVCSAGLSNLLAIYMLFSFNILLIAYTRISVSYPFITTSTKFPKELLYINNPLLTCYYDKNKYFRHSCNKHLNNFSTSQFLRNLSFVKCKATYYSMYGKSHFEPRKMHSKLYFPCPPRRLLYSTMNNNYGKDGFNGTDESQNSSSPFDKSNNSTNPKDSDIFWGISQIAKKYGLSMSRPHSENNTKDEKPFQQFYNSSNFFLSFNEPRTQDQSIENNTFLPANPYLNAVIKQAPNELIMNFVNSAPRRVQEAVKITVMGLLGTLPKFALETTILTTGEKLASLMYQLLVTGYMFKNAEYRMSLSESLNTSLDSSHNVFYNSLTPIEPPRIEKHDNSSAKQEYEDGNFSSHSSGLSNMEISGEIHFKTPDGKVIKTSASLLIYELRKRIASLQEQIDTFSKTPNLKYDDLLAFIKSLPEAQIRSLTENISDEVIEAMRRLTTIVVDGLGANKDIGNESITQQTGSMIAQLCMWQLAVGYNFRDLEVREDMRKSFED